MRNVMSVTLATLGTLRRQERRGTDVRENEGEPVRPSTNAGRSNTLSGVAAQKAPEGLCTARPASSAKFFAALVRPRTHGENGGFRIAPWRAIVFMPESERPAHVNHLRELR